MGSTLGEIRGRCHHKGYHLFHQINWRFKIKKIIKARGIGLRRVFIFSMLATVIRGDFFQQLKNLVEKKKDEEKAAVAGSVALAGTAVLGAIATVFTGGAAAPAAAAMISGGECLILWVVGLLLSCYLLPPACEGWPEVMFSRASVC